MKLKYTKKLGIILGFALITFFIGTSSEAFSQQQKNNPESLTTITNQGSNLTIYPVPVTNKVHIRLSPDLQGNVQKIEIISLIGRKIIDQPIIDANATDISFTGLDHYPSGIYMVLARDKYGKIIKSGKMVINGR